MTPFQFVKMNAIGNDFVVVDGPVAFDQAQIVHICDRRRGVGADGVLVVTRQDPPLMEYWNADGSSAEMCGNGLRCVARYAYDRGWAPDRSFGVQTAVGVRGVRVLSDVVEAEIGRPRFEGVEGIGGVDYEIVDLGNPHAVTWVTGLDDVDVEGQGRSLQAHFPAGVNVEFVEIQAGGVRMRVWERGVGETQACGTGMVAAALTAMRRHQLDSPVTVMVPGGSGRVETRDGVAWLSGPAEYSFRGSVGER